MNVPPVFSCILLIMAILLAGCTITPSPAPNITAQPVETGGIHVPTASPPVYIIYTSNAPANYATNAIKIPVLLTGTDWKTAGDCGWTADNLPETAALFMNDCQVGRLQSEGWEIVGIGYDMNFIGSRCRMSTHPDVDDSCDWCLDAGPTLVLRYQGIMTREFLANLKEKTVTGFRMDLPEGAVSVSTGESTIIRYRNGTVLYTFRNC